MPRRAHYSSHLLARVRAWFGLRQADLALYVGVSQATLSAVEKGNRGFNQANYPALQPLLPFLPATAPPTAALAALPPGSTPPDAATLDFRRRQCQYQAGRLLAQADALAAQAQVVQRWAEALPALLAATEAAQAAAAADADAAARATWRTGWLHRRARPLPAEAATQWHLLRARAAALLAEAEALAAAVGTGT